MRIGIFDSGVGGLTVARAIKKRYPSHSLIYIGDTARVPWGVRSPQVIKQFSHELLRFLERKKVAVVVVACHTASSVALPFLRRVAKVPILGVIEPSAKFVGNLDGSVGILGTWATIKSGAWERIIKKKNSKIKVFSLAAPLLVPLVEEGLEKHQVSQIMVNEYLKPLRARKVGTIILACTHYPLLLPVFRRVLPKKIKLINPGETVVKALQISPNRAKSADEFYFTDLSTKVRRQLTRFYGGKILGRLVQVAVDDL